MRVTCAAALSLRCFTWEVKVLSGAEEGKKPTEEANKRVAEVLDQQQQPQSTRKRKATVYSSETRTKIGKYASVNGMTMDFT